MAKVIAAMVLALACARQEPPGQPGADRAANQDLDQALAKAGQMNNYTAIIVVRKEGTTDSGGKDQPGKDMNIQPIDFKIMPGQAAFLKAGDIEGYRKDDVCVVKDGGLWKRIDSSADKSKDASVSYRHLAMIRPPHEILRDLKSSSFKQVRREGTEEARIFSGELTDEAMRILKGNKPGGQAATGSARIWVNGDGAISKFELTLDPKAQPGQAGAEAGKKVKLIEFREVGSTKYEVPADAMKALGSSPDKPADKPMDEKKSDK